MSTIFLHIHVRRLSIICSVWHYVLVELELGEVIWPV